MGGRKRGRRSRRRMEDATSQISDGGAGASDDDDEAAEASQQYSEYLSSQCPDEFVDAEGGEDEIVQALREGGPSRTRVPSKAPYDSTILENEPPFSPPLPNLFCRRSPHKHVLTKQNAQISSAQAYNDVPRHELVVATREPRAENRCHDHSRFLPAIPSVQGGRQSG